MKVSLITTVKNEEKSIRQFLDCILKQTRKPNEFIIVVTTDMKPVEINTPFIKYLGIMNKDQIIGKNIENLQISDSDPKLASNIIKALEKQEILKEKIKIKTKNNQSSDNFQVKFIPTVLKDGEKGIIIILSKITKKESKD